MPNHIHLILHPNNIEQYPQIISSIKHYFSRNVGQVCPTDNLKIGYKNKREKEIFQRWYLEHTIKNKNELNNHINYIHYNPVKHKLVQNIKDWEYSSFHKFVENNLYDKKYYLCYWITNYHHRMIMNDIHDKLTQCEINQQELWSYRPLSPETLQSLKEYC